jgi:hypothetical protein
VATASSSRNEPRPSTSSRWIRHAPPQQQAPELDDDPHDAERRAQRGEQARGVADLHHPIGAQPLARLVGPVVVDQLRGPRILLAQLQSAVDHGEVGVALAQHALVGGAELEAAAERSRRIGVRRLQLDVAGAYRPPFE